MSKRKLEAAKIYELVNDPDYDLSEEPMTKIQKLEEQADKKENKVWRNKQRTLVFCSRGTTDRYRFSFPFFFSIFIDLIKPFLDT